MDKLSHNPSPSNFKDSINNMVYGLQDFYNHVCKIQEHIISGELNSVDTEDTFFLATTTDDLICMKCVEFTYKAKLLLFRKYNEIKRVIDNFSPDHEVNLSDRVVQDFRNNALEYEIDKLDDIVNHSELDESYDDLYNFTGYLATIYEKMGHKDKETYTTYHKDDVSLIFDYGFYMASDRFERLSNLMNKSRSTHNCATIIRLYIVTFVTCYYVIYDILR